MYKIQHVAIFAEDNEALADFYKEAFGLVEVKRHAPEGRPDRVGIYLSDGHINLAILPASSRNAEGIHHFGFQVDDIEEVRKRAIAVGGKPGTNDIPRDGRFAEAFIQDPAGTRVDLSVNGWDVRIP